MVQAGLQFVKTCNVNTQREMILIYFWAGFAVLQYCDLKPFLVFVYVSLEVGL